MLIYHLRMGRCQPIPLQLSKDVNEKTETIQWLGKSEMALPIRYKWLSCFELWRSKKGPHESCTYISTSQQNFLSRKWHPEIVLKKMLCHSWKMWLPKTNSLILVATMPNCHQQGHVVKPQTKVDYMPLLEMTPDGLACMMTAMLQAKNLSEETW